MSNKITSAIPTWAMVTIFLVILLILGIYGDLFTFIVGAIVEILVFAIGYNENQAEHH